MKCLNFLLLIVIASCHIPNETTPITTPNTDTVTVAPVTNLYPAGGSAKKNKRNKKGKKVDYTNYSTSVTVTKTTTTRKRTRHYSSVSYSSQCQATTKKGYRCSRTSRSGGYCWQHGG
ncbi:DUF5763 domain-containing protein [Ferruginibacter sp. HRS2-29]|uniref:DUF5763 domain-containing protein n=1 Tax=Ferruginibacter sp. HRS2-29 TaxID=2487334 RepID=UPI0020CE500B|nr:DUF5763 domain-containing protein [Ferruginibacter sp. HRS2-29]